MQLLGPIIAVAGITAYVAPFIGVLGIAAYVVTLVKAGRTPETEDEQTIAFIQSRQECVCGEKPANGGGFAPCVKPALDGSANGSKGRC